MVDMRLNEEFAVQTFFDAPPPTIGVFKSRESFLGSGRKLVQSCFQFKLFFDAKSRAFSAPR